MQGGSEKISAVGEAVDQGLARCNLARSSALPLPGK